MAPKKVLEEDALARRRTPRKREAQEEEESSQDEEAPRKVSSPIKVKEEPIEKEKSPKRVSKRKAAEDAAEEMPEQAATKKRTLQKKTEKVSEKEAAKSSLAMARTTRSASPKRKGSPAREKAAEKEAAKKSLAMARSARSASPKRKGSPAKEKEERQRRKSQPKTEEPFARTLGEQKRQEALLRKLVKEHHVEYDDCRDVEKLRWCDVCNVLLNRVTGAESFSCPQCGGAGSSIQRDSQDLNTASEVRASQSFEVVKEGKRNKKVKTLTKGQEDSLNDLAHKVRDRPCNQRYMAINKNMTESTSQIFAAKQSLFQDMLLISAKAWRCNTKTLCDYGKAVWFRLLQSIGHVEEKKFYHHQGETHPARLPVIDEDLREMLQPVAALKEAWNAESQSQVVPVSARESKESRLPADFPMIREDSEPEDVKVVPAKTVKPKAKAKQTPRRRIRGKTSPEAVNKMYSDVQKKLMQFDQGLVDSLNMQVVVGGKSKKVPAKKRTKQEKQKQEQLVAGSGQKNAKTAGRASSAVSEARGRSPVQEDEEEDGKASRPQLQMVEGSDQESVGVRGQEDSPAEAVAVPPASFKPKEFKRKLNEELHEILSANMLLALLWISLSGLRKPILLSDILHEAKSGFLKPCVAAWIKRGKPTEAPRTQIMSNERATIYQVNWMSTNDVANYGELKQRVNRLLMLGYPYIFQHPINYLHRFLGPLPKTGRATRYLLMEKASELVDTPAADQVALNFRRADTFMDTLGEISCLWLDGNKFCPAAVACLCLLGGYQLLKAKLGMLDLSRPQRRKRDKLSKKIRDFHREKERKEQDKEFFRRRVPYEDLERVMVKRKKPTASEARRGRWTKKSKAKYRGKKKIAAVAPPPPASNEIEEPPKKRRETSDADAIEIPDEEPLTLESEERAFLQETTVHQIAEQSVRTLIAESHPRLAEFFAEMAQNLAEMQWEVETTQLQPVKIEPEV